MIDASSKPPLGDFTIFGFRRGDCISVQERVKDRLGVFPRAWRFGEKGAMFFHTSYGEVAEGEEALALKLGFLRSKTNTPLSSRQLLDQRILKPGAIDNEQIRGNALVACLGKKDLSFTVFKTLLGVPQLYFAQVDGGIVCSDRLVCVVRMLDRVELNEDMIPMHFLFRSTPGDLTYYRQIRRLLPGEYLRWMDGKLSLKLVQDFRFADDLAAASRGEEETLEAIYDNLQYVVGDYVNQAKKKGAGVATLLSGGVDSSLIQYFINYHQPDSTPRSFSYSIDSADFRREVQYAQTASELFHTNHTFVSFKPEDFPGQLTRSVDILAQPPILETEPSMLSIAEFADKRAAPYRYFISGQGADTVFGLTYSVKLKGIHLLEQVPASARILRWLSRLLFPSKQLSNMLNKGADILLSADDTDSFLSPCNSIAVYGDIGIIRRSFGDEVLKKALKYRRDLAASYLDTNHYLEKVHMVDLMTDTYELGSQRQQLFLAYGREQLHPFFDDYILRAAFSLLPDKRYIKGLRPKYLLKDLLSKKTDAQISKRPKGFSIFENDLCIWMKSGPLRDLIEDIRLPAFLTKADFDRLKKNSDYFLWILLNYDIFRRRWLV